MNRYYPPTIEEVWDSYEWLMKSKLEEIDHMTRQMFKEIQALKKLKEPEIRKFLSERFAALWNQVAEEQEALQRKERKGA